MDKIWMVYEDSHGDVSYWTTKEKAYEEARKVIMQDPYHPFDGRRITKEEITDNDIDNYEFCVGVCEQELNKSWA